jgi:hypothetical protein
MIARDAGDTTVRKGTQELLVYLLAHCVRMRNTRFSVESHGKRDLSRGIRVAASPMAHPGSGLIAQARLGLNETNGLRQRLSGALRIRESIPQSRATLTPRQVRKGGH